MKFERKRKAPCGVRAALATRGTASRNAAEAGSSGAGSRADALYGGVLGGGVLGGGVLGGGVLGGGVLVGFAAAALLAGCSTSEEQAGSAPAPSDTAPPESADFVPFDATSESRLVRLSHRQYRNTVSDLFEFESLPEADFVPDSLDGFEFDTSSALRVDLRLGPQYRAAAEAVAERVVADESQLAQLLPCEPSSEGCASQFIEEFGARAFRRPLTPVQRDRFAALFEAAASLVDSGDPFLDGVQLSLEAFLQSPQFLYRVEASEGPVVEGREALDGWEVASRLSYFLYDSMPDTELFEAARSGDLETREGVERAARRMLRSPRAASKLASFHRQAWQFGRFASIAPDEAAFPNVPDNFVERVGEAADLFLADVIAQGGGLREFLTAPFAYVDEGLAPLYGREVAGGMTRVELDGDRRGMLMQVGFLASNAYSQKTDPIHRGLFVLRDLLCREVPEPPPDAQMASLPRTDEPIETTRDEISLLTGQISCVRCHSQINPPGFAFEGFDAVGQVRETENGVPVDTTGEIRLDGEMVEFEGPSDLVEALAQSQEARDCYTSRWLEFANGRPLAESDDALREALAATPASVEDIAVAVATSPDFLSRGPVLDVDLEEAQ